jgi:hypothetical protein
LDLGFIPFDGSSRGPLVRPPALAEQLRDVVHVIARAESIENEPLDPFCGPQLRGVTGSLCPQSKELDDRSQLLGREFRRTARARLSGQSHRPFFFAVLSH